MRINHQKLRALGAASFAAVALVVTGCSSTDRSTGQVVNDTMTAHHVKSALGNDPLYKFDDVDVKVYNGNAELTGFVSTDQQRARAAEVASHVQGVSQVINQIMIKPTPTGPATIRDVTSDPHLPPPPAVNQQQPPPPPR